MARIETSVNTARSMRRKRTSSHRGAAFLGLVGAPDAPPTSDAESASRTPTPRAAAEGSLLFAGRPAGSLAAPVPLHTLPAPATVDMSLQGRLETSEPETAAPVVIATAVDLLGHSSSEMPAAMSCGLTVSQFADAPSQTAAVASEATVPATACATDAAVVQHPSSPQPASLSGTLPTPLATAAVPFPSVSGLSSRISSFKSRFELLGLSEMTAAAAPLTWNALHNPTVTGSGMTVEAGSVADILEPGAAGRQVSASSPASRRDSYAEL